VVVSSDGVLESRENRPKQPWPPANFNYGATGYLFTDESTLIQSASLTGMTQRGLPTTVGNVIKHGAPWQGPDYGKDPHKNELIRQGIKYRENHCGNF